MELIYLIRSYVLVKFFRVSFVYITGWSQKCITDNSWYIENFCVIWYLDRVSKTKNQKKHLYCCYYPFK